MLRGNLVAMLLFIVGLILFGLAAYSGLTDPSVAHCSKLSLFIRVFWWQVPIIFMGWFAAKLHPAGFLTGTAVCGLLIGVALIPHYIGLINYYELAERAGAANDARLASGAATIKPEHAWAICRSIH